MKPLSEEQLDKHDKTAQDLGDTILWGREMGEYPTIKSMQDKIKQEIGMKALEVPAYAGLMTEEFIRKNGQWFDRSD